MRTNTSFARKATFAYVYNLCALSGLCVQICLLRVKRLSLQCLGDSFDIAMTIVMDVIRFVQRSDDSRDGCDLIRPM